MQSDVPVFFDIRILFQAIYDFFVFFSDFDLNFLSITFNLFSLVWFSLGFVAFVLMIVFLVMHFRLQSRMTADLVSHPEISFDDQTTISDHRWFDIVQKIDSENPSDWNVAIIEADKILDDLMKKMGYPGDNLGERLKAVERSDFLTLDSAWQAHKVRNSI